MDYEDYGEIDNDELPEEEVIDYEEDLLDEQIEQPKQVQQKNDDFKQNRRQSTPYVKQTHKPNDEEEYVDEEGEVYEYEDESEMIQDKEQFSNNDDEEAYQEDEYEEEFDDENVDQTNEQSNDESQYQAKNPPQQLQIQPPKVKRPPLPQLPKKPTYKDKYADLLKKEDYSKWTAKQLKNENNELRQKLKEISIEVTKLVEENNQRLPTEPKKTINKEKKKQPKSGKSVLNQEVENNEKKLQQQNDEIEKLQYRISILSQSEYILDLDLKAQRYQEDIKKLQNRIKHDQQKLKQKGNDLEKYEMQDGVDKLLKEIQNKSIELINLRNKKSSLLEQCDKQLESIEIYKQELPAIEYRAAELELEAKNLKIDVNAEQPFAKLRENYTYLLSQKESYLKHKQIMDKKEQQLSQINKETQQLKREKEKMDREINQVEMNLLDQRKQKDQLKNQIPPELFKQIPASMTQENISNVMHSEQNKESQRKLQSAKPPTAGRQKLTSDQDSNQQQQQQQQLQQQQQQQQQSSNQNKQQIDEEIKVEEEIIEEPSERNVQTIQVPIIQTTKPPIQNKLNSKPFQIGKKTDTITDQVSPPAQNQNDTSTQGNNSQISENQYSGPSRVMRMMKRNNQPSQQVEEQYQLSTQQPQELPQNNAIQKKVEFQQPIEAEPEYKPTFQIRRNRFNNADEEPQQQQPELIIVTKQEDQAQKRKIKILDVRPYQQPEDQQFNLQSNQLKIDNQESQQNQEDQYVSRRRERGVEPTNITIKKEQEVISEMKVEPTYEFQPRQEPGAMGKRNRGNNKLNIWDQQPIQKENIHEVQEIKEIGEVKEIKEIKEVKVQENREMTLEEILGGGGGIQDHQDTNNHPVQRRKFEVPKEDYPLSQPVKKSLVDQSAKQKQLVLQAENQDLLDFDF